MGCAQGNFSPILCYGQETRLDARLNLVLYERIFLVNGGAREEK